MALRLYIVIFLTLFKHCAVAIDLNISDPDSIRDAAATTAHGVQELYNGNQTNGVLGKFPFPPYYWWESGAVWGGMISYWHFTGDESYLKVTHEAIVSQIGPTNDFILESEKGNTGNDDQAFWALAAMSAAEYGFPQPPLPYASWQQICTNVFNDMATRWYFDSSTCGGGLRWHFTETNAGTGYKNTISNGGFFQLAARLARFTGDPKYADMATRIWDWTVAIGLIDTDWQVFDGTDLTINCSRINHNRWSYNNGMYLYGAAVMQNLTSGNKEWQRRVNGLMDSGEAFLHPSPKSPSILYEQICEDKAACNVDQFSMKAYLARWLATTSQLAPFTAGRVAERLRASAQGAAKSCTGGPYGNSCGVKWYIDGYDNTTGLGQQLSAMEVTYGLLVNETQPPSTLTADRLQESQQHQSRDMPRVNKDPGHMLDPPGVLSGPQTFREPEKRAGAQPVVLDEWCMGMVIVVTLAVIWVW